MEERLALANRQPVTDSNTMLPDTFHAADAGSEIQD
jgi:hypothetical protein